MAISKLLGLAGNTSKGNIVFPDRIHTNKISNTKNALRMPARHLNQYKESFLRTFYQHQFKRESRILKYLSDFEITL